jgi:RNA 2',3'-cyclic 3'-phosphodiesterase
MRLFFALWPEAEAAAALATLALALADVSGGKPVPREKIHLTLAFLGEVEDGALAAAVAAGASVRTKPFRLRLDEVGSFHRAGVGWIGCRNTPPRLMALQSELSLALAAGGFAPDERPFSPHVTLARRIARPVPTTPAAAIAWRVDEMTLVRSETGTGRYVVMERWGLRS